MARFPVLSILVLCLLLAECEEVAETVRENEQAQEIARTGQVSIFRRDF